MTDRKIRIFINGFGRIGRTLLRILAQSGHSDIAGKFSGGFGGNLAGDFEIVGINDIEPLETCAYLFQYDSVFGPFAGGVSTGDQTLTVDGVAIPFHGVRDLRDLDLSGADLVLECTGMAGARPVAERGLAAGASGVLISGPSDEADITLVKGANEDLLAGHKIVSNASCTTNALAPLLKVLDDAYGLISGHMTTVHCYTGSQPTVDKPRGDFTRSRAAALSMVPTTTSAQKLIGDVLPHLAGRVEARAVRVPVASVSAIDLTIQTQRVTDVAAVNDLLKGEVSEGSVLGWTDTPLVSTDLRARPQSLIVAGRETSVSVGGLLRVFGWYDNEWGFSNRMLDMARLMGRRG